MLLSCANNNIFSNILHQLENSLLHHLTLGSSSRHWVWNLKYLHFNCLSIGHVWLLNVTMNFDGILKQTGPADILFWKECCSSILLTENAPASEFESNQPSFSKVWILHTFALPITNQIIFNWITLIEEENSLVEILRAWKSQNVFTLKGRS